MRVKTIAWQLGVRKYRAIFPGPYTRTHIVSENKNRTLCGLEIPTDVFDIIDRGKRDCKKCFK